MEIDTMATYCTCTLLVLVGVCPYGGLTIIGGVFDRMKDFYREDIWSDHYHATLCDDGSFSLLPLIHWNKVMLIYYSIFQAIR